MPSHPNEAPDSVCWNCDRHAGRTVAITLRSSTGAATFALCHSCNAEVYIPLVARLGAIGAQASHGGTMVVLTPREPLSAPA